MYRGVEVFSVKEISGISIAPPLPLLAFDMAENDEQTKRDALFLLDALKHVTTKVTVCHSQSTVRGTERSF